MLIFLWIKPNEEENIDTAGEEEDTSSIDLHAVPISATKNFGA